MKEDLIRKVIEKEKDRIIFLDYPGTVFYDCGSFRWLGEDSIKKYGVVSPYSLFFLKNGKATIEVTLEVGLGDLVFEELEKEKYNYIDNHKKETSDQLERAEKWFKEHFIKKGQSLDYYCSEIKESFDLLVGVVLTFQIAGGTTDNHFKDKLGKIIEKYNLKLSDQEFFYLTTSQHLSANQIHEKNLSDFSKWLRKEKLTGVKYKEIVKNKKAKDYLNKCYQSGFFLYCGYGGVKLWSLEDEYNLVVDYTNKNKVFNKLDLSNKFEEIVKRHKLPKEACFWFEAARYFSYLRDERKTFQQKIFYWQAETLEEISKIIDITRKDLEYLIYSEFSPKILKSKKVRETIEKRKISFTWIWTGLTSPKIWEGEQAEKIFNKYSVQKEKISEDLEEFKGQIAFPGRVKGYARIIFNPHVVKNYKKGSILIAGMTSPDFVPLMRKSLAIITDSGGVTCHAAIISRELKIPCIIGTKIATKVLKDGDLVEVDAEKGIVRILKKA